MKKLTSILCLLLALVCLFASCDTTKSPTPETPGENTDTTPPTDSTPGSGTTPPTSTPTPTPSPLSASILSTTNFNVTAGMMSYALYTEYQELVAAYANYSQQFGVTISPPAGKGGTTLDRTKPLREQTYATMDNDGATLEEPMTWFDRFAELAQESAKEDLAFCEAAHAAGVQLTSEELQGIEMGIENLALYATYYGYTTDAYIAQMYGKGVTQNDVRAMRKIEKLADKYAKLKKDEITNGITDAQITAEYEANRGKYDVFVDYIGYTFTASFMASTSKDPEAARAENEEKAAAYAAQQSAYAALAAELANVAANTPAQFENALREALQEYYLSQGYSAADTERLVAQDMLSAVHTNADTSSSAIDTRFKAWVTDKRNPRQNGDVFADNIEENALDESPFDYRAVTTSTYTVYLLKSALKRNTGTLRSVGHILFMNNSSNSRASTNSLLSVNLTSPKKDPALTKALADRVQSKYGAVTAEKMASELLALMLEKGDLVQKTEGGRTYYVMDPAVFEAYGNQYTEDSSVFYDNVYMGQMVKPFENWIFDDTRLLNEVSYPAAVQTDYGYHIMIYRGDEKVAWSYSIRVALAEGVYDAWVEENASATTYTCGDSSVWALIQ